MTNIQKNTDQHEKGISPLAAGITGLVLGAARTAAVVLSDDKTRDKVTKKAEDMKKDVLKWGKNTAKDLKKTGTELKQEVLNKHKDLTRNAATVKKEVIEQAEKVKSV